MPQSFYYKKMAVTALDCANSLLSEFYKIPAEYCI